MKVSRRGHWGMIFLVCLVLSISILTANAAERDKANWIVGCDGFRSAGGGFILNRDNTGLGRERLVISAVDGQGRVIFAPVVETFIVGGGLYFTEGVFFKWTAMPQTNPLTVSVVSTAGNGYPEEVVYRVQGTCDNFAGWNPPLPFPQHQTASPSVAINQSSPLVTNPQNIGTNYAGYLIVNAYRANLRSGDGTIYTVVGRVRGGTELVVLGVNQARTWWFVQVDEIRGWINNELVFVRGNLRDVPVFTEEEAMGEILPPRLYLWTKSPLYSEASKGSAVICELAGDLEYVILGKRGEWFLVEAVCNGAVVNGWFPKDFGAVRNLGNLPIPDIP